jgi:hypothetical protein
MFLSSQDRFWKESSARQVKCRGRELKEKKEMSTMDPDESELEDDAAELTGAASDPLAEPPGSRGRKATNPYEGTEADDDPGPSLIDQLEDHTLANDELLEGGEEG